MAAAHRAQYNSVCRGDGHTEAVRLIFDPQKISYEALMAKVLAEASSHKAKAQYMSAVWTQNEGQAAVVKKVAATLNKASVPILPANTWYDAEEYHQKYVEKSRGGGKCGGGSWAAAFSFDSR